MPDKTDLLPFTDRRIAQAEAALRGGSVRLLSLDLFDTLLGRSVPHPPDVFLRLGAELKAEGLLGPGIEADSFAALRYQTEYARRGRRQREAGDREITLAEIYESLPAHIAKASAHDLAAREIALEHALGFADGEIVALADLARSLGLKIAVISNSYFSEPTLRGLLKEKAPGMPEPDAFFVSSDKRCGKRTGLMAQMLSHFGLSASQVLHIGDNPVADKCAAEELGIPCLFLGDDPGGGGARLKEEQPLQWHARAARYATKGGDGGATWLRRKAGHWQAQELPAALSPYYIYGAQQMGPLLAGFSAWAATRARQEEAACLYGLMREGGFLAELAVMWEPTLPVKPLAASRLSYALATFHPDFPDHLEDFLDRRGLWTLATLMDQLGFEQEEAQTLGNPSTTLEEIPARELAQRLEASPLSSRLYERSAARRARLVRYLKETGALDSPRLFLIDLGYAATIQRAAQRIFSIEKIPVTTHGLYMVGAHVSRLTQAEGGIVEGCLAQNGNPNDFARAFCRSPELVELSCMPPIGTFEDIAPSGQLLFSVHAVPAQEQVEVQALQRGVRDFAFGWRRLWGCLAETPDLTGPAFRAQLRDIATRLVVYPTPEEAALFGHWQADSDMGLSSPRPLVSAGAHEDRLDHMNGAALAALPRRDVPWLYGVAARQGRDILMEAAAVLLRQDEALKGRQP